MRLTVVPVFVPTRRQMLPLSATIVSASSECVVPVPRSLYVAFVPAPPKMRSAPSGRCAAVVSVNSDELPPMMSSWPRPPKIVSAPPPPSM